MNRRTKIIVSVSGIFIVALALIGLTYAYFLTRINGNTNAKSISVSTTNLELTYGDGNGTITANGLMPGDTISKSFSVQNDTSNNIPYLIVLENVNNTLSRIQDLTYILKKGSTTVKTGTITNNTKQVLALVTTNKNTTDTYTLTVNYANLSDVDQSEDMGSTLEFKVNIANSIIEGKELLADNIINNAKSAKNGTRYSPTPLTTPQVSASGETEKTLSVTEDDYGDSYYYRGSVEDNYVTFNNMCWRIVRIEGDKSVKLILADKNNPCSIKTPEATYGAYVGYGFYGVDPDNQHKANYIDSPVTLPEPLYGDMGYNYDTIFYSFLYGGDVTTNEWDSNNNVRKTIEYNGFSSSAISKLKNDTWCLEGTDESDQYYYDNYESNISISSKRLLVDKNVTLKECNVAFNSKIATLTAEEAIFAGGVSNKQNLNYYLTSNTGIASDNSSSSYDLWLTLTISVFEMSGGGDMDFIWQVNSNGGVYDSGPCSMCGVTNEGYYARPAITLKSGIKIISGEGTLTNPYIIED